MKIVKVTYTVKAEFSQANMSNVNAVMSALRAAGSPGTRPEFYSQHSGTRAPLSRVPYCALVLECPIKAFSCRVLSYCRYDVVSAADHAVVKRFTATLPRLLDMSAASSESHLMPKPFCQASATLHA